MDTHTCGAELDLGSDNMGCFYCGLPKGHTGPHIDNDNVAFDETPYRVLWGTEESPKWTLYQDTPPPIGTPVLMYDAGLDYMFVGTLKADEINESFRDQWAYDAATTREIYWRTLPTAP